MKSRGLKPPTDHLKNKFDMQMDALKEKMSSVSNNAVKTDGLMTENKISTEKKFVMETEF